MAAKILIVDAELSSARELSGLLQARGFAAFAAASANDGLRLAYQRQPDLILLEAVLPDRDGWSLCRQLRELSDMPIIFLSALSDRDAVIKGLELGADDYVAKPYDGGVLVARVQAALRRSPRGNLSEELVFKNGDLRINFLNREVWIRDALTHLTPKEFSLLAALARNAGRLVTRADLVSAAWGDEYSDATDSLKLYIHYLRRKLEVNPQQPEYIATVRGVGYRFMKH